MSLLGQSDGLSSPSLEQRLKTISELRAGMLVDGDTWYVISRSWYRTWEDMCSGHVAKGATVTPIASIGPVNNSDITDSSGKLVQGVSEGDAVELVPETAWVLFEEWYGIISRFM